MKYCKNCGMDEKEVAAEIDLGGIGCAHDLVTFNVQAIEKAVSQMSAEELRQRLHKVKRTQDSLKQR